MTMSTAAVVQAGEAATCRNRWCATFWSRRVFIGGKTTCISFISILVAVVPLFVLVISTYSASPTSSPRASPTSTPWQTLMMAIKMETSNSGCSCRTKISYIFIIGIKFRAYIAGYFFTWRSVFAMKHALFVGAHIFWACTSRYLHYILCKVFINSINI